MRWWVVLAAAVLIGCTGQSMVGRWKGELPMERANRCTLYLYEGGHFTAMCVAADDKTPEWAGDGRYTFDGRSLTLAFSRLVRGTEPVRIGDPVVLEIQAGGNNVGVAFGDGRTVRWKRTLEP